MTYKTACDITVLVLLLGVANSRAEKVNLLYVTFIDKFMAGIGCHSDEDSFRQLSSDNQQEFKKHYPDIEQFLGHISKIKKAYRDGKRSDCAFLSVDYTQEEAKQFIEEMFYVKKVRYFSLNNKKSDIFYLFSVEELIQQNMAREIIIKE